jgi:hypothetical protein
VVPRAIRPFGCLLVFYLKKGIDIMSFKELSKEKQIFSNITHIYKTLLL